MKSTSGGSRESENGPTWFRPSLAGAMVHAGGGYALPFTLAGLTGVALEGVVPLARAPTAPNGRPERLGQS